MLPAPSTHADGSGRRLQLAAGTQIAVTRVPQGNPGDPSRVPEGSQGPSSRPGRGLLEPERRTGSRVAERRPRTRRTSRRPRVRRGRTARANGMKRGFRDGARAGKIRIASAAACGRGLGVRERRWGWMARAEQGLRRGPLRDDGRTQDAADGAMTYETLKVAIGEDRVGIVTMSRPEARNAMNTAHDGGAARPVRELLRRAQRGGLPGADGRGRGLLLRRRPQGAQGHDRRRVAAPARHRRADDARAHGLPDPDHRRGQRRGLCRRHGAGAGLRLRLRGAVGPLRADRGDARHHAGRGGHAEPAARGGRAPRQGDRADGAAVHGRAGAAPGAWSTRCAPTPS